VVAEFSFRDRRRVFVPQALGANEYLRVTWHETDRVVVFSHWQGEVCVAATPVRVTDTADLATLLVEALGHAAAQQTAPAPQGPTQTTLWGRLVAKLRNLTGEHFDQVGLLNAQTHDRKSA
jgi:hypothetical protein